jgi:hypothetical protein
MLSEIMEEKLRWKKTEEATANRNKPSENAKPFLENRGADDVAQATRSKVD